MSICHSARGGEILLLTPGWKTLAVVKCVVGQFSYSPQAGISSHRSARGGGDSLTHPWLESLVIIQCMVGSFSYLPQAGHVCLSFGTWWGDSFTRPRLDISRCHSAHGGVVLLLAPGLESFGTWWGDSLNRLWLESLVIVRCMVGLSLIHI